MTNLLNALNSLFTFLFSQLSSMADFITGTTLGQIILGICILSIIISVASRFIHR